MRDSAPWGLLLGSQTACWEKAQALSDGWLSASEQQRLMGLKTQARQSTFVACRYALRLLLADGQSSVPHWRLGSAAEQAPWIEVAAPPQRSAEMPSELTSGALGPESVMTPKLSLSHSGSWLACAKAPVSIGVDMEVQGHGRQRDALALADLVCSDRESQYLRQLQPEMQQRHFLQLWCLKEAYFKCVGTGVDFAKIKACTWQSNTEPLDSQGLQQAKRPTMAYGRLWQSCLSGGQRLYLALCALEPLPAVIPCLFPKAALAWQSQSEWRLYDDAVFLSQRSKA